VPPTKGSGEFKYTVDMCLRRRETVDSFICSTYMALFGYDSHRGVLEIGEIADYSLLLLHSRGYIMD
jgi:hypothetical protein